MVTGRVREGSKRVLPCKKTGKQAIQKTVVLLPQQYLATTLRVHCVHEHQTPGVPIMYRVRATRTDLSSPYSNTSSVYENLSTTSDEPVLQRKAA